MLALAWDTSGSTLSFSAERIEEKKAEAGKKEAREKEAREKEAREKEAREKEAKEKEGKERKEKERKEKEAKAEKEEKEQSKEEEEATEAAEETTFICQSLYKVLSDKPVSHSRLLPSLARAAFKKLSIDPQKDLSFIAAGRGPGSFTGLRAGLAFAKGLSMGAGIPAIGINSLEAMSADPSVPPGISVPVIDARHGEVFASVYMAGAGLPPVALSGILALKPGSFYSEIALILDSARKSRDLPEGPVRILGKDSALLPPPEEGFALCPRPLDPGALAALAARAFKSGAFRENPPLPLYGRSPEIFKTWKPPIREALS